ncbi:hypothetical protein ASD79_16805 [Caulobacter sp. Root655]|nr:hypothetical protein ASD79_16805 [Caulobacter sp. Root655]
MGVVKLFVFNLLPRPWIIRLSPSIELLEESALLGLVFLGSDQRTLKSGVTIDNQLMNDLIHRFAGGFGNFTSEAHGLRAIDLNAHYGVLLVA